MKKQSATVILRTGGLLAGAGATAGLVGLLGLASCSDYLTGQDPEPPGPLLVTRLYLHDDFSRDHAVATDTASPVNCDEGPEKDTLACTSTPFKDKFGIRRSQPTPDSALRLRVVFNKLPLKLAGADLEPVPETGLPTELKLTNPGVVKLECVPADSCTAVPPTLNTLQATGSSLSPDPGDINYSYPFGPALQMSTVPNDDPLVALEPSTVYRVVVDPALSGRNPEDKVQLDARALSLLTFTTEPFKLLAIGDSWVYEDGAAGNGSMDKPYAVKINDAGFPDVDTTYDLSPRGAIRLRVNAPIDISSLTPGIVSASVSIGGASSVTVPVTLAFARVSQDETADDFKKCAKSDTRLRNLYVLPKDGDWAKGRMPGQPAVVTLVVRGGNLRDVSQATGHPAGMGKHTLGQDIYLQANVLETEPMGYGGPTTDDVKTAAECAAL